MKLVQSYKQKKHCNWMKKSADVLAEINVQNGQTVEKVLQGVFSNSSIITQNKWGNWQVFVWLDRKNNESATHTYELKNNILIHEGATIDPRYG